jgi:manganese/zinc/iron transport system substrate-binding protein
MMRKNIIKTLIGRPKLLPGILLFVLTFLAGCNTEAVKEKPIIVATTGMLGNSLEEIFGDLAEVITLMQPGVDPHLYKATQGDLKKLKIADIVVYNGYYLEGKMAEVLEKLSRTQQVIAAAELIPTELIIYTENNTPDPHIWFDPVLYADMLVLLYSQIAETGLFDSQILKPKFEEYVAKVRLLEQESQQLLAAIPEAQRVLITAHDAFRYFGNRFNIEVKGLQGISTLSEFGLRDVSELINFIVDRGIPAIFVESSINDKSIRAVVEGVRKKGAEVKIGGILYSDALGDTNSDAASYLGMFRHNVTTIANALTHE